MSNKMKTGIIFEAAAVIIVISCLLYQNSGQSMDVFSTQTLEGEAKESKSKNSNQSKSVGEGESETQDNGVSIDKEGDKEGSTSDSQEEGVNEDTTKDTAEKDFIKWVDFNVSYKALNDAYTYDVETHGQKVPLNWIELLAVLGAKNGGNFSSYKTSQMKEIADSLLNKETTIESMTKDMQYFDYYYEAYSAVLGGLVGDFKIQEYESEGSTKTVWVDKYGLKAFLPIAKNFPYSEYDDFGVSRSYGYTRNHLGHDMMGQVGTPIIAIESGYVEELGWNQYGGWRIGIRSFDKKRYYYYGHMRKNFPYCKELQKGSVVTAGDVIGYMGRTGYSKTENVNNIETSHLHVGLQLVFDESQKECDNEIWVDFYQIIKFLYQHRSETVKNATTKEWYRILDMEDPTVTQYIEENHIVNENKLKVY